MEFFSPSINIACNPDTECKTQEQEGVTQPAAGAFRAERFQTTRSKEVTHANYGMSTSKHHMEIKQDCLGK